MDSVKTQFKRIDSIKDISILSINRLIDNINSMFDKLHSRDLNVPGSLFGNYVIANKRVMLTPDGGVAVSLINKTGADSVKGSLVSSNPAVGSLAESFVLQSNEFDTVGVIYESGIPDGDYTWIVISGIADVLWKNSTTSTKGYVAIADAVDGRASNIAVPSASPAAAEHFKEIGHVLETKSGGTDILVKCILHFN